jgi:hypothetical protein
MLNLNLIPKYIAEKISIYITEQSNKDVGNFIPEFSVSGLLWSATSVICDGNFQCFLPQCTVQERVLDSFPNSA